jgi:hypothetical protein
MVLINIEYELHEILAKVVLGIEREVISYDPTMQGRSLEDI